MKFILSILISLCLLAPVGAVSHHPALARAQELYVPVGCVNETAGLWVMGTAYPVSKDLLMTAKHVQCDDGDIMFVSLDKGKSWTGVTGEVFSPDMDAQVIYLEGAQFKNFGKFRTPEVGEEVAGFGISAGGFGAIGHVVAFHDPYMYTDSECMGGMSGSAVVGMDGKIVGMTIAAIPDYRILGKANVAIPSGQLKAFLDYVLTQRKLAGLD